MKRLVLCLGLIGGFALCDYGSVSVAQAINVDQELDQAYIALEEVFNEQNEKHMFSFVAIAPDSDLKKKKSSIKMYCTTEVGNKTLLMRAAEIGDVKKVKFILESIVFSCDPYTALKVIMRISPFGKSALSYFGNTAEDNIREISQMIIGTIFMLRFGLYDANAALTEIQIYYSWFLDFRIDDWRNGSPLLFRNALESISRIGKYHVETGNYSYPPLDSRLDKEILNFIKSASYARGSDDFWDMIRRAVNLIDKDSSDRGVGNSSDEGIEKTKKGLFDFLKRGNNASA